MDCQSASVVELSQWLVWWGMPHEHWTPRGNTATLCHLIARFDGRLALKVQRKQCRYTQHILQSLMDMGSSTRYADITARTVAYKMTWPNDIIPTLSASCRGDERQTHAWAVLNNVTLVWQILIRFSHVTDFFPWTYMETNIGTPLPHPPLRNLWTAHSGVNN